MTSKNFSRQIMWHFARAICSGQALAVSSAKNCTQKSFISTLESESLGNTDSPKKKNMIYSYQEIIYEEKSEPETLQRFYYSKTTTDTHYTTLMNTVYSLNPAYFFRSHTCGFRLLSGSQRHSLKSAEFKARGDSFTSLKGRCTFHVCTDTET